ncbi:Glutamate receptor ionotropic, delta-1 [Branchiostoma belcheri]|nr:Glutamate receptor ionotropic, delta-1 [Branchiostoma belcheri]
MGLLVADLGTAAELPGKQMCGVAGKTDERGGGSVCPVDYCGCSLLGKGVAAVLSCTSCPANFGLQTVANSLHVPHVFVSQDNCRVMHSRGYTVSMRPSQEEVDRDLVDVITRLKWKSMMILFDDYYDFSHVQNLLSLTRKTFLEVVLLRVEKFTGGNDVTEWQANAKKSPLVEYGGKLRRAVLLCSAENSVRLASGAGILTPEHNWIIANKEVTLETLQSLHTSSDVFTVMRRPLSYNEYTSRFLRHWATLTTGDQDVRSLQDARLSAAYMYDAVHLLASAFSSLLNTRGWIGPNRLTCKTDTSTPWNGGLMFMDALREVQISGVMGRSKFSGSGYNLDAHVQVLQLERRQDRTKMRQRTHIITCIDFIQGEGRVDLLSIYRPGRASPPLAGPRRHSAEIRWEGGISKQVGAWDPVTGLQLQPGPQQRHGTANRTYRVVTLTEEPFAFRVDTSDGPEFSGFCMDLLKELSIMLDYDYELYEVHDGKYGSRGADGTWSGMVGDVMTGKADFAIGALVVTAAREGVVDFTMRFMDFSLGVLMRKAEEENYFFFLEPFHPKYKTSSENLPGTCRVPAGDRPKRVWLCVAAALLLVCGVLLTLHRLQSNKKTLPTRQSYYTMWFAHSSLLGGHMGLRHVSRKILAGVWWVFAFFLLSSYTAELAAILTVTRMEKNTINSLEDLTSQTDLPYGTVAQSSIAELLSESSLDTYGRMWSFMTSGDYPGTLVSTTDRGIRQAREGGDVHPGPVESQRGYFNPFSRVPGGRVGRTVVMYEQAEPVRSPFSGPGSRQTSGHSPQPCPGRQSGSRGHVRHGNGASDKQREDLDQDTSSHTYENAEEVKRHATSADLLRKLERQHKDFRRIADTRVFAGVRNSLRGKITYGYAVAKSRLSASPKSTPSPQRRLNFLISVEKRSYNNLPNALNKEIVGNLSHIARCRSALGAGSVEIGGYGAYPDGASGRRGVCSFLRARRSCLAAGIAVLLSLSAVGLAPLTFSNKKEISQLSTTVDTLKRYEDDIRQLFTTFDALKHDQDALKRDQDDMRQLYTTVDALKRDQDDMSATVDALKRDQDDMRQLSTTVDALKRDLEILKRDQDDMRQLSTTVDALKRGLDNERSRTATLQQRLHEIGKTLRYTIWREICYKAFDMEKTFGSAEVICRQHGGTLAMPRDADTNAFLGSLHKFVDNRKIFWIGLHDQREEGKFEWVDGSALGSYNPGPGVRNNQTTIGASKIVSFSLQTHPRILKTSGTTRNATDFRRSHARPLQNVHRRQAGVSPLAALRPPAVKLTSKT